MTKLNGWDDVPYPTIGDFVYLGRASEKVKLRAKLAGLNVISKRKFAKIVRDNQAINRLIAEGRWYDTVKYDRAHYLS